MTLKEDNIPMPDDPSEEKPEDHPPEVRSLKELIDLVTGRSAQMEQPQEEAGISENIPFPFLGIVAQSEMKLALLLAVINPMVGGVLLIGPRGTGKTTAVRSLLGLIPSVVRSACFYGCLPEDIESGGIDAVCPDCALKYGEGRSLTVFEPSHLVELPLNARLEDVVGQVDERNGLHQRLRLKRGILAHADLNVLYVDEVNLLANEIVNAILDASAMGTYSVRRGLVNAVYNSRFTLIGSMNPEEGNLSPQMMDRFGLRVIVQGLSNVDDRLEAYNRVHRYRAHPRQVIQEYENITQLASQEIIQSRQLLPDVRIPSSVSACTIQLIKDLKIDTLRAEITLFEAARAYAAMDSRIEVTLEDIKTIAPLALRLRRSEFMTHYFAERLQEEEELTTRLNKFITSQDSINSEGGHAPR
jgi:magnesium chelatase subunit I